MLKFLNDRFLSPALPIILLIAGIFLSVKLRFFYVTRAKDIIVSMFGRRQGKKSPLKTVSLSLAGALGVGNITGVAAAIRAGGPGAIFWMWISAVCAMPIKYAETALAIDFRENRGNGFVGGAAYYIRHGIGSRGLAAIFSVLTLLTSFSVGNIVQVRAAADSAKSIFGTSPIVIGAAFSVMTVLIVAGGSHRVEKFSAAVIPLLSAGYIIVSLIIIFSKSAMLPGVFASIISDAFTPDAAAGGIGGFFIVRLFSSGSMRYGTSRGILSSEAGCGTSPTAHVLSDEKSPAREGFWGIFEVFADTILLCTLTALVILLYLPELENLDGTALAIAAYGMGLGKGAAYFIGISIPIYALASVICWSYYGTQSIDFLEGKKTARRLYIFAYGAACMAGATLAPSFVWDFADFCICAMTILNTVCVLLLSGRVKRLTDDYFKIG